MSEIKKLLGKRIRDLRKAKGITQEQMAEYLGIGPANISYIENGKFAPSMENFEKIARILKVEPFELYKFSNYKNIEEIREELFSIIVNNEQITRLLYKFYESIK